MNGGGVCCTVSVCACLERNLYHAPPIAPLALGVLPPRLLAASLCRLSGELTLTPLPAGGFSPWLWLWLSDPAGEERKNRGEDVGGACDCDVFCEDLALALGVVSSCCEASDCS